MSYPAQMDTNNININNIMVNSISQSSETVYNNINLAALQHDPKLVMLEIATDVIDQVLSTEDGNKIQIAGRPMSARVVKAIYMRLREHHVRRVLINTAGQAKRSPTSYIRTALYHEVMEYDNKPPII